MTPNCYKILTVSELEVYIKLDSRQISSIDTCLKTNKALVYYLTTGKIVLIPGDRLDSSKGILFDDRKCFSEYLAMDYFPIEPDKPSIEEKYQKEVIAVNKNIDKMIEHLLLLTGSHIDSRTINTSSLAVLLQNLKTRANKLSSKDLFYSALVLEEYLRKLRNGNWILLKQYGSFNPYFSPAILYPNKTIVLFWDYLFSFFKDKNATPEIYANLPFIKNPDLKLDGDYIKNRYFGFQILSH